MKIANEQEMLEYGANFGQRIAQNFDQARGSQHTGAVVLELVGDVGSGKTTFARGLARGLGVKKPVTSPSFTISRAYALPSGGQIVHYDFYRLADPGLMAEDLAESLAAPNNIVVIEWGESIKDILPSKHIRIEIKYNADGSREIMEEEVGAKK